MDDHQSHDGVQLGRLEVICGPMFAGKTTELIRRLDAASTNGAQVQVVKPTIDDRYHPTAVTTHDGRALPGRTIDEPAELLEIDAEVIGLDEAHFFEDGLHAAVLALVRRGTRVILAGLDRTSFNQPFGEMGALLIEADEVLKIAGVCAICGESAVHTIRLVDSTAHVIVGGEGMFENRCRVHLDAPRPSIAD